MISLRIKGLDSGLNFGYIGDMKLSEFITKLQRAQEHFGDRDPNVLFPSSVSNQKTEYFETPYKISKVRNDILIIKETVAGIFCEKCESPQALCGCGH